MLNRTLALTAAVVIAAACSGTGPTSPAARPSLDVEAAAPDHGAPGTPGTSNCRGQTTAFVAQASKNGLLPPGFQGVGGVAKASGLTVKEFQEIIATFCATLPQP